MTPDQLAASVGCDLTTAQAWLAPLQDAMQAFHIDSPVRQAAFLAQIGVECEGLRVLEEDLDYSALELLREWPTHFTPETAQTLGRTAVHPANQRAIANIAYADRMGNGPVSSGDGWRFRGRGCIQLTGRANYRSCTAAIGKPLMLQPDLLAQNPATAALAAAWYWDAHSCNALADANTDDAFALLTRRINGGLTDYAQRMALWAKAKQALEVKP
jgi:putative chitinase